MTAYEIIDLSLKFIGVLVLLVIWRAILGNTFISFKLMQEQALLRKVIGDLTKRMSTNTAMQEKLNQSISNLKGVIDNPSFISKLENLVNEQNREDSGHTQTGPVDPNKKGL